MPYLSNQSSSNYPGVDLSAQQDPAPLIPVYAPTPAAIISTFATMFSEYLPMIMFMVIVVAVVKTVLK